MYPGVEEETGATWVAPFSDGKIGVMPMPSTVLESLPETTGVLPLLDPDGGGSTFVGGDGIGISKDSTKADAAWNFLAWTMSDEAQVEVVAKAGNVVARTDLADNQYASKDPRAGHHQRDRRGRRHPVRGELQCSVQQSR